MNSEDAAFNAVVAERLIGTVARCFYGDTTVVVLDALIREKFIREEEMGPRLRLKEKDWRKVVNQLEEELLIQSEKVLMEDMRHKAFTVETPLKMRCFRRSSRAVPVYSFSRM